jgi:outer membrane receptor protein involved in Fe transport
VLIGLDHKWSEDQHTLFLVSRINDSTLNESPSGASYLLKEKLSGGVADFLPIALAQTNENEQTVDSFEVQQLMRNDSFQTIAGVRFQEGTDRVTDEQVSLGSVAFGPEGVVVTNQSLLVHSIRLSPYLYENWQMTESLLLMGGVSYDYQQQPRNIMVAPFDDGTVIRRQISPKAAVVWNPTDTAALRAAWTRSLSGVDLDQSVRLEPTQVAGFVQAYQNLFPDSIVGGVGGARFDTADISWEQRFRHGIYVAIAGEWLGSELDHEVGAYEKNPYGQGPGAQIQERLRYEERSLDVSLHQLVGQEFSFGLRYRLSDDWLSQTYPEINPSLPDNPNAAMNGLLHHLSLNGLFQHPSGFFCGAQASWWKQSLGDSLADLRGDSFWQVDLQAGYRFPRRHAEIDIGLLNVTGQDYNLHPINLYPDLPRQRTFEARLQLNF